MAALFGEAVLFQLLVFDGIAFLGALAGIEEEDDADKDDDGQQSEHQHENAFFDFDGEGGAGVEDLTSSFDDFFGDHGWRDAKFALWLGNDFQFALENAAGKGGEFGEGGGAEVDDGAVDVGAAVVDADVDGFAVGEVGDADYGVERKGFVGGGEVGGGEGFAVGGALAIKTAAVVGGAAEFGVSCHGFYGAINQHGEVAAVEIFGRVEVAVAVFDDEGFFVGDAGVRPKPVAGGNVVEIVGEIGLERDAALEDYHFQGFDFVNGLCGFEGFVGVAGDDAILVGEADKTVIPGLGVDVGEGAVEFVEGVGVGAGFLTGDGSFGGGELVEFDGADQDF